MAEKENIGMKGNISGAATAIGFGRSGSKKNYVEEK